MRKLLATLAIAPFVAAPAAAHPNARAVDSRGQNELSTYFAQAKPHALAFRLRMNQSLSAIRNDLNYAKIRLAGQRLTTTSSKLQKVKAPLVLSEAHGSVVRGIRICGRALVRYVDEHKANPNRALNRVLGALDTAEPLIEHWREEMLVQLRQAGLPVPLWVKNVGA